MKILHAFSVGMVSFILYSSAFANSAVPVSYSEIIFGCTRSIPSQNEGLAVNLSAPNHRAEIRLPAGAISAEGNLAGQSVYLHASPGDAKIAVGTLADAATCTVEDANEEVHPSWNRIAIRSSANLNLAILPDFSSCAWDAENDSFVRSDRYVLSAGSSPALVVSYSWTETVHFETETTCATLDE